MILLLDIGKNGDNIIDGILRTKKIKKTDEEWKTTDSRAI